MQGLYLAHPHGQLIADGRKSILARGTSEDLSGEWVLVSGNKALGTMVLDVPYRVREAEFDALFDEHRVREAEKQKWWGGKTSFYLSNIMAFDPFEQSRPVEIPPGAHIILEDISFDGDLAWGQKPYTVENPPDRIRKMPSHAQEIWIAAFNSALEQYKDEGKASATAYSAVKKAGYHQDESGAWVANKEIRVVRSERGLDRGVLFAEKYGLELVRIQKDDPGSENWTHILFQRVDIKNDISVLDNESGINSSLQERRQESKKLWDNQSSEARKQIIDQGVIMVKTKEQALPTDRADKFTWGEGDLVFETPTEKPEKQQGKQEGPALAFSEKSGLDLLNIQRFGEADLEIGDETIIGQVQIAEYALADGQKGLRCFLCFDPAVKVDDGAPVSHLHAPLVEDTEESVKEALLQIGIFLEEISRPFV